MLERTRQVTRVVVVVQTAVVVDEVVGEVERRQRCRLDPPGLREALLLEADFQNVLLC